MILDTSFLIDLFKGDPAAKRLAESIQESLLSTTSISVYEIYQGIRVKEMSDIEKLFAELTVYALNDVSAKRAGLLYQSLREEGKSIDPEDCMIAAIALEHGKSIVTKNKKHFSRINGLEIISY